MSFKRTLALILALSMCFALALPGVASADDNIANPNAVENVPEGNQQGTEGQGATYYKVEFNTNGGVETYADQFVKEGECAVAPSVPTRDGFDFNGWYETTVDEGNGDRYISAEPYNFATPVKGELLLTAMWTSTMTKDELDVILTKQVRSLKSGNLTLGDSNPSTNVAQIGEDTSKQYPTLAEAVSAAQNGDTIKMIADAEISSSILLEKTLTLDLNGKTITASKVLFNIYKNVDLTVKDSTGNGAINVTAERGIYSSGGGLVKIEGGALSVSNTSGSNTYGVLVSGSSFVMTGGSITIPSTSTTQNNYCVSNSGSGSVTIGGGTLTAEASGGNYAVQTSNSGLLSVTDGYITAKVAFTNSFPYSFAPYTIYNPNNGNVLISGGYFRAIGSSQSYITGHLIDGAASVTGGYFGGVYLDPSEITSKVADGYVVANNTAPETKDNYKYVVIRKPVAQIGDDTYPTLAEALKAAQSGSTIEILNGTWGAEAIGSLTTSEKLDVRYKSLTIQPAEGASVTFTSDVELGYDDSSTANATMTVKNINFSGATLSLGNYVQATVENCNFSGSTADGALVIVDSCCTNHKSTGEYPVSLVTVSYCTFNGSASGVPGIRLRNTGNVTLTGNTVTNTSHNGILFESNSSIDATPAKTISITGNTITEWNSGNAEEGGRAMRLALGTLASGSTVSINDNYFTKASTNLDTPDFVKITGAGAATVDLSHNYWNDQTLSTVKDNAAYYSSDAASTTINSVICNVAQIGTTKYETLADAIAAVPTDGTPTTIKMIADETISGNAGVTVAAGKNIVLDLNGFTVKNAVNENKASQVISNYGTLTIQDSSEEGDGVLMNAVKEGTQPGEWWSTPQYNYATNVIKNSGTLNVESGTIRQTAAGSICYAIDNNNTSYDSVVNINGGTVTDDHGTVIRMFCNSTTKKNEINISDGIVSTPGKAAIWTQLPGSTSTSMKKATLNISGGTISGGTYAWYDYTDGNGWDNVNYSFTGGSFKGIVEAKQLTGFISGGIYSVAPADSLIKTGHSVIANTDEATKAVYPYAVGVPVAQIGTTKYASLDAAYEAADAGDTIKLLADITYGADRVVPVWEKSVNIDLNGKTLTTNSTVNINASNNGYTAAAICFAADEGSLTISNGTIKTAYGAGVYVAGHEVTLSNLTINAATEGTQSTAEYSAAVRISSGGKVIIESGNYSGAYAVAVSNSGGELKIENGTFSGSLGSTFFNNSTSSGATKSIAITGGEFTGEFVNPGKGTFVITGGHFTADPAEYLPAGYEKVTSTVTGYNWTVQKQPVASVNGTTYTTLAEAIAAANAAEGSVTITLLRNYDMEANEPGYGYTTLAHSARENMIEVGNDITFDLDGHVLSNLFNNTFKITGKNVTVQNGTMRVGTYTNGAPCSYVLFVNGAQNFVVNDLTTFGGINVSGSTATINNLSFSGTTFYAVCSQDNAAVTLNGGNYNKAVPGAANYLFWVESGSTMNITGGTYTKGEAKFRNGVNPVITGGTFDFDPASNGVAEGYDAIDNQDGTWTVQKHVHSYVYTKPNWSWKVVNGVWSATVSYPCVKNDDVDTVEAVVTAGTPSGGEVTYTATDPKYPDNTATKTVVVTYAVTYAGATQYFKYGEAFKAGTEGGTLYDWYVQEEGDEQPVLRAKGTSVFYLPVVANATVTSVKSSVKTQEPVIMSSATATVESGATTGTVVYHVTWSLPDGAQITSEKIYRAVSTIGKTGITKDTVIEKGTQHDVNLNVRNGDYTLTLQNVKANKDMHLVLEIKYTLPDVSEIQTLTDYTVVTVQ